MHLFGLVCLAGCVYTQSGGWGFVPLLPRPQDLIPLLPRRQNSDPVPPPRGVRQPNADPSSDGGGFRRQGLYPAQGEIEEVPLPLDPGGGAGVGDDRADDGLLCSSLPGDGVDDPQGRKLYFGCTCRLVKRVTEMQ